MSLFTSVSGLSGSFCPEETPWAATAKKGGHPVGMKCARCARVARIGFGLLPWDSLKTQLQCSPDFMALWKQALENYEHLSVKKPAVFNHESFQLSDQQGYTAEQEFELLTEEAVQKQFNMKLREMAAHGIPIDKVKDERGVTHEGIFVPCGPRRWKVFATYATDYSERVHHEHQQVRASQGADLKTWWRGDLLKVAPLGMKGRKVHSALRPPHRCIKSCRRPQSRGGEGKALCRQ